jgi:alpha-mannosidase II
VHISASFGPDGLLQSITTLSDGQRTPCQLDFARYGTRNRGDRSGAYLFLPDGPGRVSSIARAEVRVVEGRLRAYVEVRLGWNVHRVTLYNSPGVDGTAVQVSNITISTLPVKGTVSRDFRLLVFFYQKITFGPLIHGLTAFRIPV